MTTLLTKAPPPRRVVGVGPVRLRWHARSVLVAAVLMAVIVVVAGVTLTTGEIHVPLADVVRVIGGQHPPGADFVVGTLRLPRLLTGLFVGAALGIGGALFQSLARNPLGSPDVVGFNTGAATGALAVILVWHGTALQTAGGAVVGGVGTALLVYVLAIKKGVQGYRLVLIGIGVAAMLQSANSYLITRADLTDAQAAASWVVGSLNGRDWSDVRPVGIALVVLLPLTIWLGRDLRMLELGDDTARALGIRAERARLLSVVFGVGLVAVATASAGPIQFVALAAPQVARRLTRTPGPDVVTSALTGAALLAASDLAAQRLFTEDLPVGVTTGAVGGVYLAWLLAAEWRKGTG